MQRITEFEQKHLSGFVSFIDTKIRELSGQTGKDQGSRIAKAQAEYLRKELKGRWEKSPTNIEILKGCQEDVVAAELDKIGKKIKAEDDERAQEETQAAERAATAGRQAEEQALAQKQAAEAAEAAKKQAAKLQGFATTISSKLQGLTGTSEADKAQMAYLKGLQKRIDKGENFDGIAEEVQKIDATLNDIKDFVLNEEADINENNKAIEILREEFQKSKPPRSSKIFLQASDSINSLPKVDLDHTMKRLHNDIEKITALAAWEKLKKEFKNEAKDDDRKISIARQKLDAFQINSHPKITPLSILPLLLYSTLI